MHYILFLYYIHQSKKLHYMHVSIFVKQKLERAEIDLLR